MPTTIVESPQARLRRELGLTQPFVGPVCTRRDNPRHVGRVESARVMNDHVRVKVRWANNWVEYLDVREVEL